MSEELDLEIVQPPYPDGAALDEQRRAFAAKVVINSEYELKNFEDDCERVVAYLRDGPKPKATVTAINGGKA